jgi:hypothetical protein
MRRGDLAQRYAQVLGRKPLESELARLHRARDAFGLRDDDAMLVWMMSAEHYLTSFEELQERIFDTCKSIPAPRSAAVTKTAILTIALAMTYIVAFAVHARESGYGAGYAAGYAAARDEDEDADRPPAAERSPAPLSSENPSLHASRRPKHWD